MGISSDILGGHEGGDPYSHGTLLSAQRMKAALEASGWNSLRNGDFRSAARTDASNATFAFWTATGTVNASSSSLGVAELAASSSLSQSVVNLQGAVGSSGTYTFGVILKRTGTVSGSVSLELGSSAVAGEESSVYFEVDDDSVGTAETVLWSGGGGSFDSQGTLGFKVETDSDSTGTLSVSGAFLIRGEGAHRGFHQERSHSNISLRGVLTSGGLEEGTNTARVFPIRGVPITTSASGTTATATVDLSGYVGGLIESGDRLYAWATQEDDGAETGRVAVIAASISGATLTLGVYSVSGLTFAGGTVKASVLVWCYPTSGSQSNRAYPYG